MIELKQIYPDFLCVLDRIIMTGSITFEEDGILQSLIQQLLVLESAVKGVDSRICQLEELFEIESNNVGKRLSLLEDEILKFYRDKEKCFYDRYGDDIQERVSNIDKKLEGILNTCEQCIKMTDFFG